MGYNGLSKKVRLHNGKPEATDEPEAERSARPEQSARDSGLPPAWDDAQDQISALLDDSLVDDDDEDDALDLKAIRQALAQEEADDEAEDADEQTFKVERIAPKTQREDSSDEDGPAFEIDLIFERDESAAPDEPDAAAEADDGFDDETDPAFFEVDLTFEADPAREADTMDAGTSHEDAAGPAAENPTTLEEDIVSADDAVQEEYVVSDDASGLEEEIVVADDAFVAEEDSDLQPEVFNEVEEAVEEEVAGNDTAERPKAASERRLKWLVQPFASMRKSNVSAEETAPIAELEHDPEPAAEQKPEPASEADLAPEAEAFSGIESAAEDEFADEFASEVDPVSEDESAFEAERAVEIESVSEAEPVPSPPSRSSFDQEDFDNLARDIDELIKPSAPGSATPAAPASDDAPTGEADVWEASAEEQTQDDLFADEPTAEDQTSEEEPSAEEKPAPALSQAEAMQRLLQDNVIVLLLQKGIVSFPQAARVLEQPADSPGNDLWRVLCEFPDVDRARVFEAAALSHGFETIDLNPQSLSASTVSGLVRMLPHSAQEKLKTLNLLPLELRVQPEAGRHRLLMATHDPSHPEIHRFIDEIDLPVVLHYAAEALITEYLRRFLEGSDEAPAAPEVAEEEDDFLDLTWEPFANDEAAPETTAEATDEEQASPAPDADEALEWKPLAEYDQRAAGETSEADHSQAPTDTLIADADTPDASQADAPAADEAPGDTSSFDGSPIDLQDGPPVPDVADWTQNGQGTDTAPVDDATPAPEPDSEPAPKPKKEEPIDVSDLDLDKIKAKDRVVAMLLRKELVTPREIKRAQMKQQKESLKEPMWRVLTHVDGVDRNAIFAEAAKVYAFKTAEITEGKPDPEFARSVMETFEEHIRETLLQLRTVPFEVDLDQQTGAIKVVFITHDPTRPDVHKLMRELKLERFELRYAPENIVTGLIAVAFPRRNEYLDRLDGQDAYDLGMSYDEKSEELIDEDALEAEISRSKLINLFEATLIEAVRQDASDVHIWPNAKKQVEIHFRIDGRLRVWHTEDKIHPEALIAVIKDNSMNVDRFERDAAQDGFIQRWIDEALIRFRVSVLPIANAAQDVRSESIVIRVLDDRKVVKDLSKLGLNKLAMERFRKAISQPHGMVILTGPTGSGKTTTLYASLHEVISPEVNVLTVEDPVEYILPGVRQIKLNNKLGLEGALRSILRHDPDVVMVGEMRDKHTAELAIKLANTGHLTFSTLHTNDAASAVTRLYKMGIEPFLIAYAINLVVAQRLIRRLCPTCKGVDPDPDPVLLKNLGFTEEETESLTFYVPGSDEHCPTCKGVGYKGRRAVSEALYFSREIRHLIADSQGNLDEMEIKDVAVKQGMMTLQDSARQVVKEGDTSILEMLRVVSSEE